MPSNTITLYVDKAAFCQALHLPREDAIYAVLLDRTGRVLWRGEGPYDARRASELQEVIAQRRA